MVNKGDNLSRLWSPIGFWRKIGRFIITFCDRKKLKTLVTFTLKGNNDTIAALWVQGNRSGQHPLQNVGLGWVPFSLL